MLSQKNKIELEKQRHSLSHIMALAVKELFPKVKFGIGPSLENGFYYDFDFTNEKLQTKNDKLPLKIKNFSEDELPKIEAKIRELIKQNLSFKKQVVLKIKARQIFKDQPYKLELIKELPGKNVSVYSSGDFTDLCKGPHIKSSSEINQASFKLIKTAGAYWLGSEKNPMLTRIYGLYFETEKELNNYLKQQEEAQKRDHRKIGKELDLFVFSDLVGSGLPLYTHKGFTILKEITDYCRELNHSIGYQEVHTPNMNKADLFKISGHYEKYKEDMFKVVSNYTKEGYYLKPMNCPQHTQIYASKKRSYKDLPIRIADFANLYRDERPGELAGLTRLRAFRQDDGHCFCTQEQMKAEFKSVLNVIKKAMQTYKMDYKIRFSLWDPKNPKKYLGDKKTWEKSQKIIEEILVENKVKYFKAEGEAAIYGPKMDLIARDSIGREWQLSTIQLDLIMPERFGLKYIDKDNQEKTPIMIHRALVGSPERFLGVLLEHYEGALPLWLSPVQVKILPISEKHNQYAMEIAEKLKKENVRTEVILENDTLGKKIRSAEMEKIPYLLIIGDKEVSSNQVAIRKRGQGDIGSMPLEQFKNIALKEIINKQ